MLPWLRPHYQFLQENLQQDSLHHALLVHGKAGVGKSELCRTLAQRMLCHAPNELPCGECKSCQLFNAGSHPDFHHISPEGQIGVDEIRAASAKLSGTAQLNQGKVLVIHDAERMTVAASNSLLKTLEEPTDNTFLVLVTSQPNKLLATILSRCFKLAIQITEAKQVKHWVVQQQYAASAELQKNQQAFDALFAMYWTRPLFLLESLQEGEILFEIEVDLQLVFQARLSELEFAEKYLERIELCVEWLLFYIRKKALQSTDPAPNSLWSSYQQLSETNTRLGQPGINKMLLFTGVMQSIKQSLA